MVENVETRQTTDAHGGDAPRRWVMDFAKLCWWITLIAANVAALVLLGSLSGSAPQQAAGAAIALGIVIIPYVFTRCAERLARPEIMRVAIVPADTPTSEAR